MPSRRAEYRPKNHMEGLRAIQTDLFGPNADRHSGRHCRDDAVAPLLFLRVTLEADPGDPPTRDRSLVESSNGADAARK